MHSKTLNLLNYKLVATRFVEKSNVVLFWHQQRSVIVRCTDIRQINIVQNFGTQQPRNYSMGDARICRLIPLSGTKYSIAQTGIAENATGNRADCYFHL